MPLTHVYNGVMGFELAEVNVARMLAPMSDPIFADFIPQVGPINAMAEAFDGFIWRFQFGVEEFGGLYAWIEDDLLYNLSVWRDLKSLKNFTYRSGHADAWKVRAKWFGDLEGPSHALWWVAMGHRPTQEEAKARMEMIRERGPTADAFSFKQVYGPPEPVSAVRHLDNY